MVVLATSDLCPEENVCLSSPRTDLTCTHMFYNVFLFPVHMLFTWQKCVLVRADHYAITRVGVSLCVILS